MVQTIGKEGGSVTSADGLFTVELPPGALERPTAVSVGRVQGGWEGVTYQVEPDGLPLKKPGKVIMRASPHSSAKDLRADPETRDGNGRWYEKKAVVDEKAGTKVVEIERL